MCGCLSRTPDPPAAGAAAGQPCDASTQPCPHDCTQQPIAPREVNQSVSETISNAPARYRAWNGTFQWQSKYSVEVDRPGCRVKLVLKIKVSGSATAAQKTAWKSAIEGKWNGRAKLVCPDPRCTHACPGGYPVSLEVRYVTSGEHYVVTASSPGSTSGGRAGLGGTTSMTDWGVDDTVDVAHEVGHMLGCVEEYFTTNGTDYTYGGTKTGFRDASGNIMNNPANNPAPSNYTPAAAQAALAIGGGTTCRPVAP
jgi:hypothetical protein